MWPSQIKKLVELVARAERSNEPSTTAQQTTTDYRQTDTTEIPPKEILGRIFNAQKLNGPHDFRKILREAGARQCEGALLFSGLSVPFYGMLGRGAQKHLKR